MIQKWPKLTRKEKYRLVSLSCRINTKIGGVPPFDDEVAVTGGTPIGRFVVGLEGTELLVAVVLVGNGPRVVGGVAGVVVVAVPEVFSVDPPMKYFIII